MKYSYILLFLLSCVLIFPANAGDSGVLHPGFNLWNWDINLMGKSIHNGTFNGSFIGVPADNLSWQTEKLNKTDETNLTAATNYNWTGNFAFNYVFGGTPIFKRNIVSTLDISSAQGAMNLGLAHSLYPTYQILPGAGPSILYSIQGGDGNMVYVGRTNYIWDNRTANTTEFVIFVKKDVADTYANTYKAMSSYSNQTSKFYGNITIDTQVGAGTRAACFDSNGVLVASTNISSSYKSC